MLTHCPCNFKFNLQKFTALHSMPIVLLNIENGAIVSKAAEIFKCRKYTIMIQKRKDRQLKRDTTTTTKKKESIKQYKKCVENKHQLFHIYQKAR